MGRDLNIDKILSMDPTEMVEKVKSIEEELFNLRFRNAMKQLENPLEIRHLRRDLARLKTVIRQKQIEATQLAAAQAATTKSAAKGGAR